MSQATTLATGAGLTPETWADFVARLHYDCVGEGVNDHYTADAVFLVQMRVKRATEEDYADFCEIYPGDGERTRPPEEYFEDMDEETQAALNEAAGGNFIEADSYNQKEALSQHCQEAALLHMVEDWETVNQHFTKEAAEAFIRRKKHDYRDGLRVYMGASTYSWELNTIKAAILSGRIGLMPDAQTQGTTP